MDYIKDTSFPIAIGYKRSSCEDIVQHVQCIFCQEEQPLDHENSFIVMILVNRSSLFQTGNEKSENLLPSFNDSSLCINVSSCGHIAHSNCWDKHYRSVKERASISIFSAYRQNSFDVSMSEYLCPLCNSLCNSVLPLLPSIVESPSSKYVLQYITLS